MISLYDNLATAAHLPTGNWCALQWKICSRPRTKGDPIIWFTQHLLSLTLFQLILNINVFTLLDIQTFFQSNYIYRYKIRSWNEVVIYYLSNRMGVISIEECTKKGDMMFPMQWFTTEFGSIVSSAGHVERILEL